MRKITILSILALMMSCKTYKRHTCLKSWHSSDQSHRISVWEVKVYDRKTRALLTTKIDTVVTLSGPEHASNPFGYIIPVQVFISQ